MSLRRLAESGADSHGRGSARGRRSRSTKQQALDGAQRLSGAWGARVATTTDSLIEIRRPDDAVDAYVRADTVRLSFRSGSTDEIHVSQVRGVTTEPETDLEFRNHHWSRIRIRGADGDSYVSIPCAIKAGSFEKKIEDARRAWWRSQLATRADDLQSVSSRLTELDDPPKYVDVDSMRYLKEAAERAVDWFEGPWWPQSLSSDREIGRLEAILDFVEAPEEARRRANEAFVTNEIARSRNLFDRIETHPLTQEQRRAVVVDERHNLVIAAAGSGKTSVIVAKAAWLVERGFRRPSELLLLAYDNAAREEMEKRIRTRVGTAGAAGMTVRTFHGLCSKEIIGEAEGRRPSVASVASDGFALRNLLEGFVEALPDDRNVSASALDWFQHLFAPYKSQHDFKSWGEYYDYLRRFSIRALNGDKVKSFEEVVVANFLYLNGVRYEYEVLYEHDTAASGRGQYKPDFFLPDYRVYIEHFGLDAEGNTASYVDRKQYLRDMKWKRETHERHGTVLIETFSHEHAGKVLLRRLKEKLTRHDVTLSPIPPDRVFAMLRRKGRIAPFTMLAETFLRHFKGTGLSFATLAKRAADHRDRARSQAFLKLFRPIYERYQQKLDRSGEIDFDDMINQATKLVDAGRYQSPFRYILVDEFQDISPARVRLLKALLRSSPGARLFAVGDGADYVVVLSLCSGKYGFPTEMVDDPVLDLVLAAPEGYPNAEERRLLYVAITRARRQAFLLADGDSPSPFVNELIVGEYDVVVFGRPPGGDVRCPRCAEGRMTERRNTQDGSRFYGCTNYPWCPHTRNAPSA